MKKYFLFLFTLLLLAACQKQPTASFTTDKTEYIAGETVHLSNTSSDAYSYFWTMPDGTTANTQNADYTINQNMGFGSLKFYLEADSKKNAKSSYASKSVNVIPASIFSIDGVASYRPLYISNEANNNSWVIIAQDESSLSTLTPFEYLIIYLPNSTLPTTNSVYSLQSNNTNLLMGQASLRIVINQDEYTQESYTSLSGQLQITITNGKVNAAFSHINAQYSKSTSTIYKLSGNITCH